MRLDLHFHKQLQHGERVFTLNAQLHSEIERTVILGPSGSGKSLLLKMIAGLIQPDSGYIRLNDTPLFDSHLNLQRSPQERNVAYVFQSYALFPHLTVKQNVAFALETGWLNPRQKDASSHVQTLLEKFGLADLAHYYPTQLSGGQQQRTALARVLVKKPQIILLDEPFSALDADLRMIMRDELLNIQQAFGVPMLMITHDPEDANILGTQVLRMKEGELHYNDVSTT